MNTEGERQYFFLSKFYHWGGAVTFTTHLLNSLRKKRILYIRNTFENDKDNDNNDNGNFGYGIEYKIVNEKFLEETSNPFIVDFFRYNHILDKLKRDDITIVIHDPTEISKENESYLRYWKIICIRKTLQQYLKKTYDIESKFLYHPFYPYSRTLATIENISHNSNNSLEHNSEFYNIKEGYEKNMQGKEMEKEKSEAVSISRVEYGKNIEIIMDANRLLRKEENNTNNHHDYTIKIHGPFNPQYVKYKLGGEKVFRQYYRGTFKKSFAAISYILNKAKFVVDLSIIPNDGGGTQYTFLEAIHHNAALIINRKWIEGVDSKYCNFKEGYNCYAVSNGKELAEIIKNRKNIDTIKVISNAKKLLYRHINVDWSSV